MFRSTLLDYKSAGTLNKLVFDYLENEASLRPFYGFAPDRKGFTDLLKTNPYSEFDRTQLSALLLAQSKLADNSSETTLQNIELVKNKKTLTVTTGHQLCLFTGPLYFIYKIFSTLNLAESLKKQFPDYDFVPVYWMASEDHDFEEVSSFHTNGRTIKWESEQTGAVGDFKTAELKTLMPAIRHMLGISENANYLYTLFENAYLNHDSLANATRYLVNELFGKYGLVIIDGNDAGLKNQLKDIFEKDIFESAPAYFANESITKLEAMGYHAQVKPRDINCFYLEQNLRARLEKNNEAYNIVGTDRFFSRTEISQIIAGHPEQLSPNVVLRPLYQQIILPNIAYVGGPGELAYWLEFKEMFDKLNVFFPILMPRNFLTVVDAAAKQKADQLKFHESDFFKPEQDIVKEFMFRRDQVFNIDNETEKIKEFYGDVINRVNIIDKTLSGNVLAEQQRTLKRLESIAAKSNKALKKNSETELKRISAVKESMFPGGTPQERYENFSSLYIKYGPGFFDSLKNKLDPFSLAHQILTEETL